MTSKPHLAAYTEPPQSMNISWVSACGRIIHSPKIVDSYDMPITGQQWKTLLNSLNSCPACFRALEEASVNPPESLKAARWHIYAVVERDSKLGQRLERAGDQIA